MATRQDRFDRLLAGCRSLYEVTPALRDFSAWPDDLKFVPRPSQSVPAVDLLKGWDSQHPVHLALQDVAECAAWQQSYREAQVGQQFLNSYGFVELFGPDGHYVSATSRAFIGYWGRGLLYDWHQHEAEEIYAVISGGALFQSEGKTDSFLKTGETRSHKSFQSHAISMTDGPLLAFAMWRGAGMSDQTSKANRFTCTALDSQSG